MNSLDSLEDGKNQTLLAQKLYIIKTNHIPCLSFQLSLQQMKEKNLDFFLNSLYFMEGVNQEIVLDQSVCGHKIIWENLFHHIQTNEIKIDNNLLDDTWLLYDYFFSVEHDFLKDLLKQIKNILDTYPLEKYSISGIRNAYLLINRLKFIYDLQFPELDHKTSHLSEAYLSYQKYFENYCLSDTKGEDLIIWDAYIKYNENINRISPYSLKNFQQQVIKVPFSQPIPLKYEFFQKWLGPDCIWAGGSLINCIDTVPLLTKSDIDLWVFGRKKLQIILETLQSNFQDNIFIVMEQSVITILFDQVCPFFSSLQLIYAGEYPHHIYKIIQKFDVDAVRCFSDGKQIFYYPECLLALRTRKIRYIKKVIYQDRIEKMQKKGFTFESDSFEKGKVRVFNRNRSELDYFFPNTHLYTKQYNLVCLKKFYPQATIVSCNITDIPQHIPPIHVATSLYFNGSEQSIHENCLLGETIQNNSEIVYQQLSTPISVRIKAKFNQHMINILTKEKELNYLRVNLLDNATKQEISKIEQLLYEQVIQFSSSSRIQKSIVRTNDIEIIILPNTKFFNKDQGDYVSLPLKNIISSDIYLDIQATINYIAVCYRHYYYHLRTDEICFSSTDNK